jgi:serine protease inhibitor
MENFNIKKKSYSLAIANRVYVNGNYKLLESFQQTIKENFHSEFENLDFSKNEKTAKVNLLKFFIKQFSDN